MNTLILISEPKAAKRLKNAEYPVVSLNDATSGALISAGIKFRSINDFISEKQAKKINEDSMIWLKQWSDKCRIKKITYKEISLWWFFDFWLYDSFFKWDVGKNIVWYVNNIQVILKKTKPKKIIVYGNSTVIGITRKLHRNVKGIKCNEHQVMHAYIIDQGVKVKHCIRKWVSKLHKKKPAKKDIVFATYTSWYRSCVREDGSITKEDAILGYIIRAMKRYDSMITDMDYNKSLGIGMMKQMKDYTPFESYFTCKIDRYAKRKSRSIKKQWLQLDNLRFRRSCEYKGVNIYPFLKPWLDFVFRKRIVLAIKYIEAALEMLDKADPKLVCVVDETALYGRSIVTAAKLKNIPVVAVQHGYITSDSFEYMHLKNEVGDVFKPHCPIADKTFVYGPYTKEILVRGNYPEDSVEVTGQPRYDCLAKGVFSREKVFRQYRLDKKKKLILWTTQDFPGQEEVIFNAVKKIENAQLLIKLHPRELGGVKPYYEKAKKIGLKIKAVQDANTFELLHACDVMITMHSTTGLEAIMMNKPVVILNISGHPDMVPYVQENAAIGVYKASQLEGALRKALFDYETIQKLKKNSKDYSYRHSYKMDGKATSRVVEVIKNLI